MLREVITFKISIWENIIKRKSLYAGRSFTYTDLSSVLDFLKQFLCLSYFSNTQLSFLEGCGVCETLLLLERQAEGFSKVCSIYNLEI